MREVEFNVWDRSTNTMLTDKDKLRFKIIGNKYENPELLQDES